MQERRVQFSYDALKLVSNLRGISWDETEWKTSKAPLSLKAALDKFLAKRLPNNEDLDVLDQMRTYWQTWFQNTNFAPCIPERFDKQHNLWLRVPNPILKQQLQFQQQKLLIQLKQYVHFNDIRGIRWLTK